MGYCQLMPDNPIQLITTALIVVSVSLTSLLVAKKNSPIRRLFDTYTSWWHGELALSRLDPRLRHVPLGQVGATTAILTVSLAAENSMGMVLAAVLALVPPRLLVRHRASRIKALEMGLDSFLVALADSLAAVPNLAEALQTLSHHAQPPIKDEVETVLWEVRLGRSLDDALINMAGRLKLPGLDAAVGAALLGKRTGGDLPSILRGIASTLREMNRLEGVVKSKTAEGRSQAWVMGAVPPGLIGLLDWINPDWLAPLWNDPIGWLMLAVAAVLEVSAIALIRKIMAVDI